MMMGGVQEGGHADLVNVGLRRGKVTKNYHKISAEPITAMIINGDNLFTGSEDGYLLNFSIVDNSIVGDFGWVSGSAIEGLASCGDNLFVLDHESNV